MRPFAARAVVDASDAPHGVPHKTTPEGEALEVALSDDTTQRYIDQTAPGAPKTDADGPDVADGV